MAGHGKTVGIIGGMGPESTADLFLRIIRATPAERDQDHLRVIIHSDPSVPDRTEAILSGQTQPVVDALVRAARTLEGAGAQLLAMPCNTAHYFLPQLRSHVQTRIVDMIDEAAAAVTQAGPGRVGLHATTATVGARLYHDRLARRRVAVATPSEADQERAMAVIKTVKRAGVTPAAREDTARLAQGLQDDGAEAIIAGCTEFSLVLAQLDLAAPCIDPLDALARAVVREALSPSQ